MIRLVGECSTEGGQAAAQQINDIERASEEQMKQLQEQHEQTVARIRSVCVLPPYLRDLPICSPLSVSLTVVRMRAFVGGCTGDGASDARGGGERRYCRRAGRHHQRAGAAVRPVLPLPLYVFADRGLCVYVWMVVRVPRIEELETQLQEAVQIANERYARVVGPVVWFAKTMNRLRVLSSRCVLITQTISLTLHLSACARVCRADQIAALEQQVAEAAEEQSALVEKSRAYVVRLRDQLNEEHTTTVRQVPCPSPVSDGCLSCQTPKRRFCPDGV